MMVLMYMLGKWYPVYYWIPYYKNDYLSHWTVCMN